MNRAFEAVFLAHAPDAEPQRHRCVVETSKYKLFTAVGGNVSVAVARGDGPSSRVLAECVSSTFKP